MCYTLTLIVTPLSLCKIRWKVVIMQKKFFSLLYIYHVNKTTEENIFYNGNIDVTIFIVI